MKEVWSEGRLWCVSAQRWRTQGVSVDEVVETRCVDGKGVVFVCTLGLGEPRTHCLKAAAM